MRRRLLLAAALAAPFPLRAAGSLNAVLDEAGGLDHLETVLVAIDGEVVAERGYRGHSPDRATNIKSASKLVISALTGIAIDKGALRGVSQPMATILADSLPRSSDPRMQQITIGNLLSMQAGLRSTSGRHYGAWVGSPNWVRAALAQPFEAEPGGPMVYSTGSTHLLSAILTRRTGRSSLQLTRDWLGDLPGFAVASWMRDPQGIYVGGNEMAMTPRSLLAFGELYRRGGVTPSGQRLISERWIAESWQQRTNSRYTGDGYGYGWFLRRVAGEDVFYGWGFGGQMLYLVPSRRMSVAMTSDDGASAARNGHRDALHALLGRILEAA
ncbi:serine hydrolase [Acetobacteraceae bacterium H6797]|nr:serine hydrolase [Acetobacteraceae bacterium H6797]